MRRGTKGVLDRNSVDGLKALAKKDLWFEPASRRVLLVYPPVVWAALFWAFISPAPSWLFGPVGGGSAGAVLAIALSVTNPFLISMGYVSMIQREKSQGSFVRLRVLPIDPGRLLGFRALTCFLFSVIPTSAGYVALGVIRILGMHRDDPLMDLLWSLPFVFFLLALTLVVSTLAVGLAMNLNTQQLTIFATIAGLTVVLFPFIFSRAVMGLDAQELLIKAALMFGNLPRVVAVLFASALVSGLILASAFRRKKAYT